MAVLGALVVLLVWLCFWIARRRREHALDEFRRVISPSSHAFWIADGETERDLWVSPAYESLWEITLDELLENRNLWAERVHPDDRSSMQDAAKELRSDGQYDRIFRIVRRDGEVRWLHNTAWEVCGERGQRRYFVGTCQDITDSWNMRAELVDSESRYRRVLDKVPIGIAELDREGRFLTANRAGYQRCGEGSAEGLVGVEFLAFVDSAHLERIRAALAGATEGVPQTVEFRQSRAGATAASRYRARIIPIRDETGDVGRLLAITEDVTAERQAESDLVQSERRFGMVADNISQVFWLDLPNGETIYANHAYERIWGRSVAELCSDRSSWISSVHPEDRTHILERMSHLESAGHHEYEYRILRPDGEFRWISERAVAVRDDNGEVEFIAGTSTDITPRKQAEEGREAARRNLAHLLQTADLVLAATNEAEAIEHIADGVCGAGWRRVTVSLFEDWKATVVATRGMDPDAVAHFEQNRPDRSRRMEMYGKPFERFRISRSYLVPEAWDLLHTDRMFASDESLPLVGDWQPTDLAYVPLRRPGGEVVGAISINDPVDGRRPDADTLRHLEFFADLAGRVIEGIRGEARQARLMRELDHRVRNNLGVVLALSQMTRQTAASMDEFARAFEGRIHTLARTHETLAQADWKGTDLEHLLKAIMAPHIAQVRLEGEPVVFAAKAISPLCMAIHELTTNAVKHGALSVATGEVLVHWHPDGDRTIELEWIERGGPTVTEPRQLGQGSGLIRGFIEHDLGGDCETSYDPSGFYLRARLPVERVDVAGNGVRDRQTVEEG